MKDKRITHTSDNQPGNNVINIDDHSENEVFKERIDTIFKLTQSIKSDFSAILRASKIDNPQQTENINIHKQNILHNLKMISDLRTEFKDLEDESWNKILYLCLRRIYKHGKGKKIRDLSQILEEIDTNDISTTGVHFIVAYMKIVARIPDGRSILPFKPHK
jgi:hypothetical protein